jgi:hypothetical protein
MNHPVSKIVSGGQTGADRGGLDAAIELGIPHGGWCPKGRKAEDGAIPLTYDLTETGSADYRVRTEKNVLDSDATAIFTCGELSGGSKLTADLAEKHGKPWIHIDILRGKMGAAADFYNFICNRRGGLFKKTSYTYPRESRHQHCRVEGEQNPWDRVAGEGIHHLCPALRGIFHHATCRKLDGRHGEAGRKCGKGECKACGVCGG